MLNQLINSFLSYPFLRNALLTALLLSVVCACLGQVLLLKHLALASDAFSHSALTGVALAFVVGYNPTVAAITTCIIAALLIEFFRHFFPNYAELAIAIIMSLCIGLAGIFSKYTPSSVNLNAFLFGSIISIGNSELLFISILLICILLIFIFLYRPLYLICLDERNAALLGIKVKLLNCLFNILTAICVAVASHSAGTLIVSSLLVLPVATALCWQLSYLRTLILAICIAILNTLAAFCLALIMDWPTGGTLVVVSTTTLLLALLKYALVNAKTKNCY